MKVLIALLALTATAQAAYTDPMTGYSWLSPVETLGMVESEARIHIRAEYGFFYGISPRLPVWQLIENVGIENIIDIFGETQLPEEDQFRQTAGWSGPPGHMVSVTNMAGTDVYTTERVTGTEDFYTLQPLPIRTFGDPMRGDNLGFWFVKIPEPTSITLLALALAAAGLMRHKI